MVRASGTSGSWHVEWAVKLDDVIGSPIVHGDKLLLNIKQVCIYSFQFSESSSSFQEYKQRCGPKYISFCSFVSYGCSHYTYPHSGPLISIFLNVIFVCIAPPFVTMVFITCPNQETILQSAG